MNRNFDNLQLLDNSGEPVGAIHQSYVDDNGNVKFFDVKTGSLLSRHHLVPADRAEMIDGGVRVPYLKGVIEESPAVHGGDTLEEDSLDKVQNYYDTESGADSVHDPHDEQTTGHIEDSNSADREAVHDERNRPASDYLESADGQDADELGKIRDLGDVIEVPIVEEILVKKPVVKEVVRIHKSSLTEHGIATADLRKESVQVVQDSPGTSESDTSGRESNG